MLMREFRDAAVDRAPDGMSAAPQVEVDASGASPSVRCRFEVVLILQVLYKQSPFILVPGPLQQLQLVEASEHHLVVQRQVRKGVSYSAGWIAKQVHPDRGVNQHHRGHAAGPCDRSRPGAGSSPRARSDHACDAGGSTPREPIVRARAWYGPRSVKRPLVRARHRARCWFSWVRSLQLKCIEMCIVHSHRPARAPPAGSYRDPKAHGALERAGTNGESVARGRTFHRLRGLGTITASGAQSWDGAGTGSGSGRRQGRAGAC